MCDHLMYIGYGLTMHFFIGTEQKLEVRYWFDFEMIRAADSIIIRLRIQDD